MVNFREHLGRQISFLKSSCERYDQGHVEEAVRLALHLRVILHDTNRCISLLQHLGAKSIFLLSTAKNFDSEPDIPNLRLAKLVVRLPKFSCPCVPLLGDSDRSEFVLLQTWWRKETIIDLREGRGCLNRRDLILAAADKDGGAHVDHQLDPIYEKAQMGAGMSVELVYKDNTSMELPFVNIHYASLRQIAYEVLNSPALLTLAENV